MVNRLKIKLRFKKELSLLTIFAKIPQYNGYYFSKWHEITFSYVYLPPSPTIVESAKASITFKNQLELSTDTVSANTVYGMKFLWWIV